VAPDPSQIVRGARQHLHRAKRSTGRLFVAGLGFSAAYFFDAAQGRARRQRVVGVIRRVRRATVAKADDPAGELPRIGGDPGPKATFQRPADGNRASTRV
jgi:hypothetical protein